MDPVTKDQKQRFLNDLQKIAKENLTLIDFEHVTDTKTVLGSELACLRIFHKYKYCDCRIGETVNKGIWFFSLYFMPFGEKNN